jgi:hypothetical protein
VQPSRCQGKDARNQALLIDTLGMIKQVCHKVEPLHARQGAAIANGQVLVGPTRHFSEKWLNTLSLPPTSPFLHILTARKNSINTTTSTLKQQG